MCVFAVRILYQLLDRREGGDYGACSPIAAEGGGLRYLQSGLFLCAVLSLPPMLNFMSSFWGQVFLEGQTLFYDNFLRSFKMCACAWPEGVIRNDKNFFTDKVFSPNIKVVSFFTLN